MRDQLAIHAGVRPMHICSRYRPMTLTDDQVTVAAALACRRPMHPRKPGSRMGSNLQSQR